MNGYAHDGGRCTRCARGREACAYCCVVTEADWRAMCDCGLHDFGEHIIDCVKREPYRWVVAIDHENAAELRPGVAEQEALVESAEINAAKAGHPSGAEVRQSLGWDRKC